MGTQCLHIMPLSTGIVLTLLLPCLPSLLALGSTPRYLIEKINAPYPYLSMIKRNAELPTSWHLGKRAPWALERSSLVINLLNPEPSKDSPVMRSLSARTWNSQQSKSNTDLAAKRATFPEDFDSQNPVVEKKEVEVLADRPDHHGPEVEAHAGAAPYRVQRITPNFWLVPPGNRFNPWVFDVMNSG